MHSNGFDGLFRTVDDAFARSRITGEVITVTVSGIRMTAGGANRATRRVDPGPDNYTRVDGVAKGDNLIFTVAQVAHGGETGQQCSPCIDGGAHYVVGRVPVKIVGVRGGAELIAQVRVTVDQAWQTGLARQVNFGRAGSRTRARSRDDFAYALALNDHGSRAQHSSTDDV